MNEDSPWLEKRNHKESGRCCACGTRKYNAFFYDWYVHPAVRHLFDKKDWYNGKICLKCAKREIGTKSINKLKE